MSVTCAGGRSCTCGCCAPLSPETPRVPWNRPGLTRLDYRVGTYATFRRTMLDAISGHPGLRDWTARTDEDYGVALLSMWAYLADILTFYGERAIHEAFLGTALEDRSLRRLAAMVDYLPAPGAAAEAVLAYTAEAGKPFEVRPRMRVQSVPGQDEKPQVFEPLETVPVAPALDAVPILAPIPTSDSHPLGVGATSAPLASEPSDPARAVAVGDRLLALVGGASRTAEEKVVEAITEAHAQRVLHWRVPIGGSPATLFRWRRKTRLFGYDAPYAWLKPTIVHTGDPVTWTVTHLGDSGYEVEGTLGDTLNLDRSYDIGPGALVAVTGTDTSGAAFADVFRVTSSEVAGNHFGPLSGATTRLHLDAAVGVDTDLRGVTVYELSPVDDPGSSSDPEDAARLDVWPHVYAPVIPAGASSVLVRSAGDAATVLPDVDVGRRVVLSDGAGGAHAATVLGPPTVRDIDGVGHLEVQFDPPLEADLDAPTAVLRGNAVAASHGQTVVKEVLGSGDATQAFQRFEVARPQVTYLTDPTAEHGARSTLEVRVDGVRWDPVRSLYGAASDARVYVERVDETSRTSVRFGDGVTGARVHSGKNNVTATYRHGLGLAGRVGASTLRVALDRPPGLRAVGNPAAAAGGADPERGDRVRANAPNGVRTFDRIVSLTDFEDAARAYAGVAKARAVEGWDGEAPRVRLCVAGDDGAVLDAAGLAQVRAYLDARRDRYRRLTLESFQAVHVAIEIEVEVDPDHLGDTVIAAVTAALEAHFAFDARDLGEAVRLSELYRVVQTVDGVVGADFVRLGFSETTPPARGLTGRGLHRENGTYAPVQPRLLLYAEELAVLDPAADLRVRPGIPGVHATR